MTTIPEPGVVLDEAAMTELTHLASADPTDVVVIITDDERRGRALLIVDAASDPDAIASDVLEQVASMLPFGLVAHVIDNGLVSIGGTR